MTDTRQPEVIYFIATRNAAGMATTANDIINNFRHWFPNDTAENLGLFLTKMVKAKMIEVVDGRYQVYDDMAHSQDVGPENDNQLNLFK